MAATATDLRIQDLAVTRERYEHVTAKVEREPALLARYERELDMLHEHLLANDPNGWTYL